MQSITNITTKENSLIPLAIVVFFFFSGVSALIYEVTWARMLGLVFGTTAYAWATVLSAYMGGMALGAFFGGRLADRSSRPLRLFALCEACIGLLGAASFAILQGVQYVFVLAQPLLGASTVMQILARVALCAGALTVPTMLMGATLPLVARGILAENRPFGGRLGAIYAVNTFGACTGTLLTGFALIPMIGMSASLCTAAGINCGVAAFALVLYGNRRLDNKNDLSDRVNSMTSHADPGIPGWLLPLVLVISGFCAMACEVLWARALVFFLSSTTYAFTSMLSMVLLGIAFGAMLASKIARGRHSVAWIAALQMAIGLLGFAYPWMLHHIAPIISGAESHLIRSWLQWILVRYAVCFGMIFPMALCMGLTFPLAIGAAIRSLKTAGRSIGSLTMLNTIGGIAGSLAAAFLLVPAVGVQRSFIVVAAVNCVSGLVLLGWGKRAGERASWKWAAPGAALLAALFVYAIVFAGKNPMVLYSSVTLGAERPTEVASYAEDQIASVSVLKTDRDRTLNIDGFNAAGTYRYEYMHLLAHLPVLLSASSDTALVICFGTGTTCGTLSRYPFVKQVDCVELSPAVISMARYFSDVNYHAADNPKVRIIRDDGRNHLLRTRRCYDVISLEPMHPYLASATNLYSSDFYRLCKKRLSPHGVMAQWAPMHVLSTAEYRMLIASFASVFPHTSLWFLGSEGILIGAMDPLTIDLWELKRKMSSDAVLEDLKKISLADPLRLLSCFLMDEAAVKRYVAGAPPITDDLPRIEFSAPHNLVRPVNQLWRENMDELLRGRVPILPFVLNGDDSMIQMTNRFRDASSYIMKTGILNSRFSFFEAMHAADSALTLMPGDTTAAMARREAANNALRISLNNARGSRKRGILQGAEYWYLLALTVDSSYTPAHTELITLYTGSGMMDKALEHARKVVALSPRDPSARTNLGIMYMNLNRQADAESELLCAINLDSAYGRANYFLGMLYQETGRKEQAMTAFKRAEAPGNSGRLR